MCACRGCGSATCFRRSASRLTQAERCCRVSKPSAVNIPGEFIRTETKACSLDETEDAHLCSEQMRCVVDVALQYGLEVMRRTGDDAQHFRDGRPVAEERPPPN